MKIKSLNFLALLITSNIITTNNVIANDCTVEDAVVEDDTITVTTTIDCTDGGTIDLLQAQINGNPLEIDKNITFLLENRGTKDNYLEINKISGEFAEGKEYLVSVSDNSYIRAGDLQVVDDNGVTYIDSHLHITGESVLEFYTQHSSPSGGLNISNVLVDKQSHLNIITDESHKNIIKNLTLVNGGTLGIGGNAYVELHGLDARDGGIIRTVGASFEDIAPTLVFKGNEHYIIDLLDFKSSGGEIKLEDGASILTIDPLGYEKFYISENSTLIIGDGIKESLVALTRDPSGYPHTTDYIGRLEIKKGSRLVVGQEADLLVNHIKSEGEILVATKGTMQYVQSEGLLSVDVGSSSTISFLGNDLSRLSVNRDDSLLAKEVIEDSRGVDGHLQLEDSRVKDFFSYNSSTVTNSEIENIRASGFIEIYDSHIGYLYLSGKSVNLSLYGGQVREIRNFSLEGETLNLFGGAVISGDISLKKFSSFNLGNPDIGITKGIRNIFFLEEGGTFSYNYNGDYRVEDIGEIPEPHTPNALKISAYDHTFIAENIAIGEIYLISGNLMAESIETPQLILTVNDISNPSRNNNPLVFSETFIDVDDLSLNLLGTSDIRVGESTQTIELIGANEGIDIENLHDMTILNHDLFDVTIEYSELGVSLTTTRISDYETAVTNSNTFSSTSSQMAEIFDELLENEDPESIPENIRDIMEAIDNNTANEDELSAAFSALQPASSIVYSSLVHNSTLGMVNNLSENISRSETSPWFSSHVSVGSLLSSKDVVGYDDTSAGAQVGYNHSNGDLTLGLALGYTGGKVNSRQDAYKMKYNNYNFAIGYNYLANNNLYTRAIASYTIGEFDTEKDLFFFDNSEAIIEEPDYGVSSSEIIGRFEVGYVRKNNDGFVSDLSIFYSISSIRVDSYQENGISALQINESTTAVNNLGVSASLTKNMFESFYSDRSLSPFLSISSGLRHYSDSVTEFSFINLEDKNIEMSNGNYLPVFILGSVGISYTNGGFTASGGYTIDTNIKESINNKLFVNLSYGF